VEPTERRRTARLTLAASGALAATVVPVFLTGALSGPLGEDLGFGATGAGVAVTTFFVAAGATASAMSRVTQRVGPRTAMRIGIGVSAVGCLGIGILASSFWHLLVAMAVVGAVVGLVDTAAASAFAAAIRRGRQGLAFGIKEASVPVASMVAGVSVPVAAAWLGWRAAFVTVAALLPLAWLAVPRPAAAPRPTPAGIGASGSEVRRDDGGPVPSRGSALGPVRWMALGIGAGAGAANAAATLLVPAATAGGLSASAAGILLAVASVASVLVRVGAGWATDRSGVAPVRWVALALALGAVGSILLAVGGTAAMVAGALLALGAGWGWTGLAFLAVVRMVPEAPARAAGIVLTGLAIGGAIGPSAFAAVSARASTSAAWWLATAGFLLGAAMSAWAGRAASAGGTGSADR
jgi:predicted MFS family arabinose efflux permease